MTLSCVFIILVEAEVCDLYGQEYNLITDSIKMFWPVSPLDKPAYLETVTDPDFGTKITRITGDPGTDIPNISGTWKDIARHGYSKRAVWNADESLIYLEGHKGGPNPLFLDGETYEVLFSKAPSSNERRWHPTNPDVMIIVTDNAVKSWNVRENTLTTLVTFSGYSDWDNGDLPIQAYIVDFRDVIIAGLYDSDIRSVEANIYPNPASEYIMVPDQYYGFNYRIVSVNGHLVDQGKISTDPINVSTFQTGLYIIELRNTSENKRYSFSVIKN